MDEVKVSISCITFNHVEYIRDCLEGFLMQQTNFNFEILIHDDASTDGTIEVIKDYRQKYPHLIFPLFQTENQYSKGVKGFNLKYNFPRAKGKYIALCEGDDYWTDPLKLQKQVDFLEAYQEFSLTCGGFLNRGAEGLEEEVINKPKLFQKIHPFGFEFGLNDLHKAWLTKTLTVLFRKEALKVQEITQYSYLRDVHLYYHLIREGKGFYFQEIMGVYNIHGGGVHSMISKKIRINTNYQLHKELYSSYQDSYTKKMFLNKTLRKLKYDLRHCYSTNNFKSRFRLLWDSFRLISTPIEVMKVMKYAGFFILSSFFTTSSRADVSMPKN